MAEAQGKTRKQHILCKAKVTLNILGKNRDSAALSGGRIEGSFVRNDERNFFSVEVNSSP